MTRLGRMLGDLIADMVAPLLRMLGVRFIHLQGNRIGECGASLGYYAQSTQLGWARPCRGGFVAFPTRQVFNPCYLNYWRRYTRLITNPFLYSIAFRLCQKAGFRYPLDVVTLPDGCTMFRDNALTATQMQWAAERRSPLLALDPDHEKRGREALSTRGMDPNDWFVALHVRESGYLSEPPNSHRENRNADVFTYLPAVRVITDRGGWVVRVGDPSMKPLPEMERVIDYVHTPLHSDWMDVLLGASCRLFLGTSSGLFVVPWSFGRPVALANWESLRIRPWGNRDLFIPKLWRLEAEDRFLTVPEMLQPPYAGAERLPPRESRERRGVTLVDNTPEEIVELVEEWLDGDKASPADIEKGEVEKAFDNIVSPYFPYGSPARIGSRFLDRHRGLVMPGDEQRPRQASPID